MAPKTGRFLLLFIVACSVMAKSRGTGPGNGADYRNMARRLMRKCREKEYPVTVPKMNELRAVFNSSDSPTEDRSSDQSNTFLSTFMNMLDSFSRDKGASRPMPSDDKMTNMMWNCSDLLTMVKRMRNASDASACYMHAFVSPRCWAILTQSEDNMDSEDYDALQWGAKPLLRYMPSRRMKLPARVTCPKMQKLMKLMREVYENLSADKRAQVPKWVKQQFTKNKLNCTMMPDAGQKQLKPDREPSREWLNLNVLNMMGPYISHLKPEDVDSSPKEKLCEFFRSAQFKSTTKNATNMNPSLAKKFLRGSKECFGGKDELVENVDKLGKLVCYYDDPPNLTPEFSRKLLSELEKHDDCVNPRLNKLKKRLVRSVMSNSTAPQAQRDLGSSVAFLSTSELSVTSFEDLKDMDLNAQWTPIQMRALVKTLLGKMQCEEVSGEKLRFLQSVARGLPSCVLKLVKAKEILDDPVALKNISMKMRKGQLKAILEGLRKGSDPSDLVRKIHGALLRRLSLKNLARAKINSVDQANNKTWRLAQALYLVTALNVKPGDYRRLHSLLQGITCKMINKMNDTDMQDLVQALAVSPQWISKVQAGCAARQLFKTLEERREDYFKTITAEELDDIPAMLLVHLPPWNVKDLPDSVCQVFLDKMEEADLSLLPRRSPSRLALAQKDLLCLGGDLSKLTTEEVSRFGPLLCELQTSQLSLMAPDVLKSSLQAMAKCQHVPQRHREGLAQLVTVTFGDESDWSSENMEDLGRLLLWDDKATAALPKKPWMKDVLYFLMSRMSEIPNAVNKKLFDLTVTSYAARKKRAVNSNVHGNRSRDTETDSDANPDSRDGSVRAVVPTEDLITELGTNSVFLTADQFDQMSVETFNATIEILRNISDYNAEQLAVLSKKATEALGPVSQMTESEVILMGCITWGFPSADLEMLPLSLDSLEEISHCGCKDESQMRAVWKRFAGYNKMTAQQLGAVELVALNQSICVLNSSEIAQLDKDALSDALDSLDGVQCPITVTQQLKTHALSVFGEPRTLTEAEVSDLGNIIAGFDATELASLDPSVFPYIRKSCIPNIPPSNLASLSVAQLEALGPVNAEMVTKEQQLALTGEQLAGLERAATGSFGEAKTNDQTETAGQSGAPSLSVEGIASFMKPLVFLLTGFLLL